MGEKQKPQSQAEVQGLIDNINNLLTQQQQQPGAKPN
jgi:hypothetical protein